jgi:hypothetical protein
MKKLFILIAIVSFSTMGFSQKFDSGDKNVEVNFTPFGGFPISIDNIRLRLFHSDSVAFRLGIGVSLTNEKTGNGVTANEKIMFVKESTFNFNIRPGFEKHFKGTNRLSPYWGAELDFAIQTHAIDVEYESNIAANVIQTRTTKGANGFIRYGINALVGFDYYFVDKLYFGTEIGFGFGIVNHSDIKVSDTNISFSAPHPVKQKSTMNIGPLFNNAIRLGYCF